MKRSKPIQRRTPVKRVSDRRRREMAQYSVQRRAYLAKFFLCQIELAEQGYDHRVPPVLVGELVFVAGYNKEKGCASVHCFPRDHFRWSTEIHHGARRGRFYLDESTWWAASSHWHDEVERHPSWARARGYLVNPRTLTIPSPAPGTRL